MKGFLSNFKFSNPQFAISFFSTCYSAILCGGLLPTLLYSQSGWGPDTRLVFMQGCGWYPRAACCGDTIHLVWWQHYAHDEVFYKRSTDAGLTWGEDVMLSVEDGQSSDLPQIAVSGNTVHVIWSEDDFGLLYRRSTNGGATWQDIDSIVPGMVYSSIQAMGNVIYIAGTIGVLGMLRFTKSYDGGNTWQPITNVTKADAWPRLRVIRDDTLYIVVCYGNGPAPVCQEVFQILSYNGGDEWLDSVMVSYLDSAGSQWPAMDTDGSGGVHITWYDYKYSPYAWTGDIFYRASRDSGNTWGEIDSLTVMHRAVASDILAEGNNLHLVWEDDRNGFDDNFEIYYRMSTDLGRTWGFEERLTNAPYKSIRPSLAWGGRYLHLFWQDRREYGNSGSSAPIYYKRKDLLVGVSEAKKVSVSSRIRLEVCPNPFNHEIQIRYWILDTGCLINDLTIEIFDVSGKEVVFLRQRDKEIGRQGQVKIDTYNLPCGVYFVQVEAGNERVVKKIIKTR